MHSRLTLGEMTAEEKRPPLGELKLDESYFGGKRKGKRGPGCGRKVAVFGVLERAGKVYNVAVPDCRKETLMAKIEAATVKGSIFNIDEFVSDKDLSIYGKHVPIDYSEANVEGPAQRDACPRKYLITKSFAAKRRMEWAMRDLNPRHPACKAGALTS
jgi:transposase-like protein